MSKLVRESSAIFSPCKKYRFVLCRVWDTSKPYVMFIGLNPSKANSIDDDPTIKRVKAMAEYWGYGGIYMLNCFPYISTDPDELSSCDLIEQNDSWLNSTRYKCKDVVFAWGSFDIVKEKARDTALKNMFPDAMALIINKDGSPRHPLYVPVKTPWIKY